MLDQQDNFHEMLTWFLNPKSISLDKEGPWRVANIAKNLCSQYQFLQTTKEKKETNTITIEALQEEDYIAKDKDFLTPVITLKTFANKQLKPFLKDFLVHGSMATLDYAKGWSDFDTFVIIKGETFKDHQSLIALRTLLWEAHPTLLEIDPLQHHSFIYCTEFDLTNYPSYYLPKEVLPYSKSLFGNTEIEIHTISVQEKVKDNFRKKVALFKQAVEEGIFKHHVYQGEYLLANYENSNNAMYQMKYFLAVVMILPSLYLEAKGQSCYKKFSFEKVKEEFTQSWDIIEKASKIRLLWETKEQHPYQNNNIPEWLKKELGNNYFEEAYLLISEMDKKV